MQWNMGRFSIGAKSHASLRSVNSCSIRNQLERTWELGREMVTKCESIGNRIPKEVEWVTDVLATF